VRVVEARVPLSPEFRGALQPVQGKATDATAADAPLSTLAMAAGIIAPPARITGTGTAVVLDPAQNDAFRLINRALADGGAVHAEAGRYVVSGVAPTRLEAWANDLSLRAERRAGAGGEAAVTARRVALYEALSPSMDEGWTEWLLDQHEFKYTVITNADFQAGDLASRFDVILFASDRARTLRDGFAKGRVPPAIEGGLGDVGIRALDEFVRKGGTMVAINQSTIFAIEQLRLPVKNVVQALPSKEFFASGSIVEVITDPAQPMMAGMPERAKVFVDQSPVFSLLDGFEGAVLAKYAKDGSPLLSGYLLGEKHLQGNAAAVDVKHGRGHVVLIGFRPQWRGQTIGTFRVVFNAALYGRDVADHAKPTPGFWSASRPAPADAGKKAP